MTLSMENNDLNQEENKGGQTLDARVTQGKTFFDETFLNQAMTNEEKLEILRELIQAAEQNLESNGLTKRLIK